MVGAWSYFVWIGPLLIGGVIGWSSGKSVPVTRGEALRAMGKVILWATVCVYVFQLAWFGIAVPSGGLDFLPPLIWTMLTSMFWLPVTVIAFIIRVQRERRE